MQWTKRQIIQLAFEEAGLAHFAFDLTPDQVQSALLRLDSMMTGLNQQGLQIGYNAGDQDPDADSGLPDGAYEMAVAGLAIRIAPSYGKQIGASTAAVYSRGLDALKVQAAHPQNVNLPAGYPVGAGYKLTASYAQEFTSSAPDTLSAGDTPLEI